MQQLTDTANNNAATWEAVIADLAAKRQAAREHLEQLRTQKQDLALEAAMGGADAQKRLAAINRELARLDLESADFDSAISQAELRKRLAEAQAAETAERERKEQVAVNLGQYFVAVQEIDDTMRLLVAKFAAARQHLDRAEALMNGQERTPFTQVRSLWGATLAAAHFGLGDHVQLGDKAMHYPHRKPLADYTTAFVAGWLKPSNAKEQVNGR